MNKPQSTNNFTEEKEAVNAPKVTPGHQPIVVLESIEGQLLSDYLEQHGRLSEKEIIALMRDVFATLQYIHSKNIIFRDIKPSNILITPDKKTHLIDFGLARTADRTDSPQVFTPAYAPPEMYVKPGGFDVRSDVYSLGATLFHLILGHTPPDALTRFSAIKDILLKDIHPDVSPRIIKAIEKALEVNPENRWSSVREFWSAMTDEPFDVNTNQFTKTTFLLSQNKPSYPYPKLTPFLLTAAISPYLNAIAEIQNIIDDARKREHQEVSISSVSQNSPISVSLDGASEAIGLIKDTVIPWRRKHAETMSRLLEQEKQAEIELKKAEILEKRAHAEKERVESTKQRGEAEKLGLENEKLRLELQRAKVQLAIEVLSQIAPNLSEADRIAYIVKLLPPLDVIIFSEFEISDK